MSGRVAAFKVAVKNSRRNKKRTFFLVALVAAPVVVAVVAAGVFRANYITWEERALFDFGAADLRVEMRPMADGMPEWFEEVARSIDPEVDVMMTRTTWRVWGDSQVFGMITDFDLNHPIGDGLTSLTTGGYPLGPDDVVLTEYLAGVLEAGVGDHVDLMVGGSGETRDFKVVGLASHPVRWRDATAFVTPASMDGIVDTFRDGTMLMITSESMAIYERLNSRWQADKYQFYPEGFEWPIPAELSFLPDEWYMSMTREQLDEVIEVRQTMGEGEAWNRAWEMMDGGSSWRSLPGFYAEAREMRLQWFRSENPLQTAPVIGTAVAAILLVEVAFIAGAAFATGTRRRLREIGLMGSNGGSDGHLKATVVGEGVVVGLLGGVIGAAIGLLAVMLGRSTMQRFVERRIDEFPVQALDLAGPILLAIVACSIAAWLPSRKAASVPTVTALQGRMPVSESRRWVTVLGLVLAAFGTLLLGVGLAAGGGGGSEAITVFGVIFMIGGVAVLAGPLVAWVSKHARRFPSTPRMVLRDSGRNRTRAAAAVAATMVIVILPVVALAGGTSSMASERIYGLPPINPQMLIRGVHDPETFESTAFTPNDVSELRSIVDLAAGAVPDATGVVLLATQATVSYPATWELERAGVDMSHSQGGWYVGPVRMAIANPELLQFLGDSRLDTALQRDGMVLIGVTERTTEIGVNGIGVSVAEVPLPVHRTEFPRLLVTEDKAASFGEEATLAIGVIEMERTWLQSLNIFTWPWQPVSDLGLNLDTTASSNEGNLMTVMLLLAMVLSLLVVLIVVATITGLSAAEADRDIQTVVAVGAPNSIRRRYLGLQSFMHTFFGALLAIPLALLLVKVAVSSGWSYTSIGSFGSYDSGALYVPWLTLGVFFIGLPVLIGLITAAFVRSSPLVPPQRAF